MTHRLSNTSSVRELSVNSTLTLGPACVYWSGKRNERRKTFATYFFVRGKVQNLFLLASVGYFFMCGYVCARHPLWLSEVWRCSGVVGVGWGGVGWGGDSLIYLHAQGPWPPWGLTGLQPRARDLKGSGVGPK